MPNWCECDLRVEGPKTIVEKFLTFAMGEESVFDFNRIVPMPPELSEVPSGSNEMGYRAKYGTEAEVADVLSYPWVRSEGVTTREELIAFFERTRPEMMATAERYKANADKYGATTWYDWSWEHWGTKWNAHEASLNPEATLSWEEGGQEMSGVEINFETAWGPPEPVIRRASELFPELEFDLRYFECGDGFSGMYVCKGGEVLYDKSGDYFGNRGG